MQEGGLARPRYTGDRHNHMQRNAEIDVLQVVSVRTLNFDLLRSRLPARVGQLDT